MTDTPETQEAVERWRQGKINIFDEMARLERERNQISEDWKAAKIEADTLRRHYETADKLCAKLEQERDALIEQNNAKPHVCRFTKLVDIRWLHWGHRDAQIQRQLMCDCGKRRWVEINRKWAVVEEDTW